MVLAFFTFARLGSLVPPTVRNFDPSRFPVLADLRLAGGSASLRVKFSKTRQRADGGFWVPLFPHPARFAALGNFSLGLLLSPCRRTRLCSLPCCPKRYGSDPSHSLRPGLSSRRPWCLWDCRPQRSPSIHFGGGGCSLAFGRGATEADLALHGDWSSDAIRNYYPAERARARIAALLAGSHSTP